MQFNARPRKEFAEPLIITCNEIWSVFKNANVLIQPLASAGTWTVSWLLGGCLFGFSPLWALSEFEPSRVLWVESKKLPKKSGMFMCPVLECLHRRLEDPGLQPPYTGMAASELAL